MTPSTQSSKTTRRRGLALTAAVASLATILAVGGGPAASVADQKPTADAAKKKKKTTKLTLRESRYGPVLFDGRNRVLYLFAKDGQGPSQCFGACATAWPPFMKRGRLVAGAGVNRSLLGSVARGGRRQVTFAGKPLYYYEHDGPGQILCHNVNEFGGLWLVVQASGEPAP